MATAAPALPAREAYQASPLIITIVVMGGTFMTVLDSTIANVALPFMQASLGAATDTITWVLTSYIIATAIATPITGWLADRIGRRRLFFLSIIGFVGSSMLCGAAQSLPEMVVFRMMQGASGAFLAPLGQAFVLDAWPRQKHGQAMSLWGVGIMVGPILGPVIGGWLTDNFDWRWVFYINVPFGIATLLAALAVLPHSEAEPRRFDITGFAFLAIGVAALQLCLDRGQQLDWFQSWEVRIEGGIAAAALWAFGVHVATRSGALLDRKLLADRNVTTGFVFITLVGLLMVSTTALLPTMLENLFGYPVITTGMTLAPRGAGMMAAMLLVGRLIGKIDPRLLLLTGLSLTAASLWGMSLFSPEMGAWPFVVTGVLQGAGLGMTFVPLNTMAFATLPPNLRTDASGFYMLLRNIGGSFGVSLAVGVLARQMQVSHADIGSAITPYTAPWATDAVTRALGPTGDTVIAMVDAAVNKQAAMVAYIDVYRMMAWVTLAVIPLLLFLKPPRRIAHDPALSAME
jgi:DHA2 family multidrug resistance protein